MRFVTLVGWTWSRAPILPSGSEPSRLKIQQHQRLVAREGQLERLKRLDSSGASQICCTRITDVTAIIAGNGPAPQCLRHWRPASSIGSKPSGSDIGLPKLVTSPGFDSCSPHRRACVLDQSYDVGSRMAGLAVRVRVAIAVARLRACTAAAAHADVTGLDRPRLLAGRIVEVRLDGRRRAPRRSAICRIERPSSNSR